MRLMVAIFVSASSLSLFLILRCYIFKILCCWVFFHRCESWPSLIKIVVCVCHKHYFLTLISVHVAVILFLICYIASGSGPFASVNTVLISARSD